MVDKQDRDVPTVRKFFQKPDVLIVICVQIAVISCATNALQGVNHDEFCVRMLCQKLLDLLFQAVLERVGHSQPDTAFSDVSPSVTSEDGPADDEKELTGILDACELSYFEPEVARVFENAIERLFYSDNLRIGQAVLSRSRVRSRLHRLNYFVLQEAEIKLHANRNVPVRDSTKYVMSTIYNCITETESDLLVDPYLNSLRSPPGKRRG